MKKHRPRPFSGRKVVKMLSLTRLCLVALACSVGAMTAAPAISSESQQQDQTTRRTVTGRVTDSSGKPLGNVGVTVRGADNVGTTTDARGQYSITVARGATLEFSYVGMSTREITVANQSTINVSLEEVGVTARDVIVTGIFDRPKESFTGSATLITRRELQQSSSQGLIQGISNVDPAFKYMPSNMFGSDPNKITSANITMRGTTSLMDYQNDYENALDANRPLFVIDRFPASIEQFVALDESRVASITVLKDASATALYGTEAANGVVVVTTVQPQEGKLRVIYKGNFSLEAPDLSSYNLMDATEKLDYELLAGMYTPPGAGFSTAMMYSDLYYRRRLDVARGVNTDWLHFPLRKNGGFSHTHNLTLSGGEGALRYSVDIGNIRKTSVMKGSYRNTFTGNMYLNYQLDNFVFSNRVEVANMYGPNSRYGNFADYTKLNAYYQPYDENGDPIRFMDDGPGGNGYLSVGGAGAPATIRQYSANPLFNASLPSLDESRYTSIKNEFATEWSITDALKATLSYQILHTKRNSDKFLAPQHTSFENENDVSKRGSYDYTTGQETNHNARLTLQYSKYLNEKHFLLLGITSRYAQDKGYSYGFRGVGFSRPDLMFLPLASFYPENGRPSGSENILRRLSGSFFANYMYDNRFYADLTVTADGSSEYGSDNRVAPTGAIGVGWNLHNESFLQNQSLISRARVRASYGLVGSKGSYNAYDALRMYDVNDSNYRGEYGMTIYGLGNPALKWQSTREVNLGADLNFLQDRFSIIFDWYDKTTNDLITNLSIPTASGMGSYKANIGKVRNRGFELQISADLINNRERNFRWTLMGNAQRNKNTILEIGTALDAFNRDLISTDDINNSNLSAQEKADQIVEMKRNPAFLYKEGESMQTIFAVESKGIDPATGNEVFVKLDGTETFEWDSEDRRPFGTVDPKIWGTFGTTVYWKGWALTAWFYYTTGANQYNNTLASKVENIKPYYNADRRALYDRWTTAGQITSFKRINDWSDTYNTSRFVMKESTFRCTSLSLQYTVPREWAKRNLGMEFLELQGQMEDLFYISTIKNERSMSSPFSRNISMTVRVTF